jgi:hypothetical protein
MANLRSERGRCRHGIPGSASIAIPPPAESPRTKPYKRSGCSPARTGPIAIAVQVFSDEIEAPSGDTQFSPDAKDIASTTLRLRSERMEKGDGRVYLIVTTATDTSGNQSHSCATVVVPHSQKAAAIASANAQAAAAKAFCEANDGAAPAGFVMIGIGPVVGPKQ